MRGVNSPRVCVPASLFFLFAGFVTFAPRSARAQDAGACTPACLAGEVCVAGTCMTPACRPACGAGESCVNGTCMVPAARPTGEQAPPVAPAPVAPAPVTAPAPVAAPPPAVVQQEPAPVPVVRTGSFVVPMVGVSSFMESSAEKLGPGMRLAGMAGGYVTNEISLGGSLTFDWLNWDLPSGVNATGFMFEAAFTPLLHVGDQRADFVFGPALGAWMTSNTARYDAVGNTESVTANGWALGGNLGVFVPLASVRVGGMVNFMVRETLNVCASTLNGTEICQDSGPAHKVLAFSAAAMF